MSFIPILSTNNKALGAIDLISLDNCNHWYEKKSKGAFTRNVKSVLSENLGGILGGTQCWMGDCLILSEC